MMVSSFYSTVLVASPKFRSTIRVKDLGLLEPVTREAVTRIIADAAQRGIVLAVGETYRSQELQQLYFARGATQLRTVGVHHYGLACDLWVMQGSEILWKADYSFLGDLAKAHGLVWGGDWGAPDRPHSFLDMDHVQRIAVSDQGRLFSGEWYPSPDYKLPTA